MLTLQNIFGLQHVECLMVQMEELCENNNCSSDVPNKGWRCLDEDDYGASYSLEGLPESFYDNDDLASGETILVVSNAAKDKGDKMNGKKISVNPGALVSTKKASKGDGKKGGKNLRHGAKHEERKLAQLQGTSTMLVIHVTDANGDASPQTASGLASDVFSDTVNLVRNFEFLIQK
jgi:hypothetical protein